MDVQIGNFVGVYTPKEAQENSEVFWVVKEQEIKNVAWEESGEFHACGSGQLLQEAFELG